MEDAGLKDTKRIGFSLDFDNNASKAGQERSKLRASLMGRPCGSLVAAAHG
jgi:hypothetical protein